MAYESNYVSLIGNLTDEPEIRFTGNGAAKCSLRLAVNRRWNDRDGNQREETSFVTAIAWRSLAENVAESLHKGDRAIVLGRLVIRSYEDKEGQTRWVTEVEADEIAPSLRWAKAVPQKTSGNRPAADRSGEDFGGVAPPVDDDVPF